MVPAFDVGRKAGLGLPVTASDLAQLAPSWQPAASAVSLPVYYSWEFSTGETADFESLVRLLQPRPIDERVGTLPLDVGAPGSGLPPQTDAVLPMRGALQPVALAATPPSPAPPALQAALAQVLNAPADALAVVGDRSPWSRRRSTARPIRPGSASRRRRRRRCGWTS